MPMSDIDNFIYLINMLNEGCFPNFYPGSGREARWCGENFSVFWGHIDKENAWARPAHPKAGGAPAPGWLYMRQCASITLRCGAGMSLAIAFKGSEGVVLAADSRVTLPVPFKDPNGKDWVIPATFDNATKLLKIAGQNFVAAVTYGLGTIGHPEPRTAHSLLPELEAQIDPKKRLSVEDFAKALSDFFMDQWNTRMPKDAVPGTMVFLVAGFDEKAAYGRVFEIQIPTNPTPAERFAAGVFGPLFGGQQEITARLLNGFDPPGLNAIKEELGLDDPKIKKLETKMIEVSSAKIPYQFLPLQDCVDLSMLLVRTTAQIMEYQTSVRGVGGAIDVATITRQEGFRYVQHKEIRGEHEGGPNSSQTGCSMSSDWVADRRWHGNLLSAYRRGQQTCDDAERRFIRNNAKAAIAA